MGEAVTIWGNLMRWEANNNQVLVPKLWDWLWILNRLIRFGHMYLFCIHYILSKVILFAKLFILMSFFTTSINFILESPNIKYIYIPNNLERGYDIQ